MNLSVAPVDNGDYGLDQSDHCQRKWQDFTLTKSQRDCIVTSVAPVAQVDRATDS